MNRIIIIIVILFLSSCQVFKKGGIFSKKKFNNLTIHANTSITQNNSNRLKLKTKINIFQDSIVFSFSPILGIEVFKLHMTNELICVDNKLQNKKDSLVVSEIDPKFKLKTIKNLIINSKRRRDTTRYENTYMASFFTDYVNKQNLFLPQKIIFWTKNTDQGTSRKQSISIDYKAIKYGYKSE